VYNCSRPQISCEIASNYHQYSFLYWSFYYELAFLKTRLDHSFLFAYVVVRKHILCNNNNNKKCTFNQRPYMDSHYIFRTLVVLHKPTKPNYCIYHSCHNAKCNQHELILNLIKSKLIQQEVARIRVVLRYREETVGFTRTYEV
jgi:hypothetical protein